MTIVAGCSLFNGVLIASDCRATIRGYGRDVHVDALQKLFPISSHAVIGFAGDVLCAAQLLRVLGQGVRRNPRRPARRPASYALLKRLPGFFRHHYEKLSRQADVEFMVASAIPGHANIIERTRAIALLDRFRTGNLSAQRNFLPSILVEVLRTPPEATHIRIEPPYGLLYTMRSPDFVPRGVPALGIMSIGSGQSDDHFEREADMLLALHVGYRGGEAMVLQQSVARRVHSSGLPDVGGLAPCFSIGQNGVKAHGFEAEIPIGGDRIRLEPVGERWVQHHVNSGTRVTLRYPWEIDPAKLRSSSTFEYLRSASRRFAGLA